MKKIYISILAFTYCLTSIAQTITEDKIDPFDSTRIIMGSLQGIEKSISDRYFLTATKHHKTNNIYIMLTFMIKSDRVNSISDKNNVLLKFDNGEILTIKNESGYKIVSTGQYISASIDLPKTFSEKINKGKISKVRIETSSTNIDFDLSDQDNDELRKMFNLISERLGIEKK